MQKDVTKFKHDTRFTRIHTHTHNTHKHTQINNGLLDMRRSRHIVRSSLSLSLSLSLSFLCFLSSLGRRFSSRANWNSTRAFVYLFALTAARDDARGKIEATRTITLTRIIIAHLSFSFFLCARA
jgi:hypothetical protein